MGDEGATALSEALKSNATLTSLKYVARACFVLAALSRHEHP